jgi:hypothetical protein
MQKYTYVLLVVLVIIVLYKIATWNVSAQEEYLYGFWVAEDDDFCEESEISSMMVMIGAPESGWFSNQRTCYIVVADDICSQGFNISYTTGWASIGVGTYRINCEVQFDDENIWPDEVTIEVNMQRGTMRIYAGETVYAMLNKQHEITNLCFAADNAEIIDA